MHCLLVFFVNPFALLFFFLLCFLAVLLFVFLRGLTPQFEPVNISEDYKKASPCEPAYSTMSGQRDENQTCFHSLYSDITLKKLFCIVEEVCFCGDV